MITQRGRLFFKLTSGWVGLLQMIIRMGWPFVNDHPDFTLSSFPFSTFLVFLQQRSSSPSKQYFFSFKSEDRGSISRTFLVQCVLVYRQVKEHPHWLETIPWGERLNPQKAAKQSCKNKLHLEVVEALPLGLPKTRAIV